MDVKKGQVVVVEIKLRHNVNAWWWLHYLYIPVLKELLGPDWAFYPLEVCQYYDPSTIFPGRVRTVSAPGAYPGVFPVWVKNLAKERVGW